jgi:hypothetical protein
VGAGGGEWVRPQWGELHGQKERAREKYTRAREREKESRGSFTHSHTVHWLSQFLLLLLLLLKKHANPGISAWNAKALRRVVKIDGRPLEEEEEEEEEQQELCNNLKNDESCTKFLTHINGYSSQVDRDAELSTSPSPSTA